MPADLIDAVHPNNSAARRFQMVMRPFEVERDDADRRRFLDHPQPFRRVPQRLGSRGQTVG